MAERVAVARAAHQELDSRPLIFEDPLALPIIGASGARLLEDNLEFYQTDGLRRARSSITVRSRFTEEQLERSLAAGATQYVILGAGLDTFAYRRADLREKLTVYEVDQPDTQRWKLERLAEAGITAPPNLRFVPVDFNERNLAAALADAGFERRSPTFFSWLGVLYYLPPESVVETLRFAGGQEAPCTLVFDFAVTPTSVEPAYADLVRAFLVYNETAPERWRTWYTPEEMKALLAGCGFTEIEHLDWAEIERRYLAGRPDNLLTSPLIGLIAARTG
jgi:methyltransferase (TIGR00027 family)